MSESDDNKDGDDYYQGVKIQKLPTIGKAFDNRSRKWRGSYTNLRYKKSSKMAKQLLKIAKALKD